MQEHLQESFVHVRASPKYNSGARSSLDTPSQKAVNYFLRHICNRNLTSSTAGHPLKKSQLSNQDHITR